MADVYLEANYISAVLTVVRTSCAKDTREEVRHCEEGGGNCTINTRTPPQQTEIETVNAKCLVHTHQMTPSSSEDAV